MPAGRFHGCRSFRTSVRSACEVDAGRPASVGRVVVGYVQLPHPALGGVVRAADMSEIERSRGAETLHRATRPDPCLDRPCLTTRPQIVLVGIGLQAHPAVLAMPGILRKPSLPAGPRNPPVRVPADTGQGQLLVSQGVPGVQQVLVLPAVQEHGVLIGLDAMQLPGKHPHLQSSCRPGPRGVRGRHPELAGATVHRHALQFTGGFLQDDPIGRPS